MSGGASLLWLRGDLRLADNPALIAAIAAGAPVIPIFIWAPEEDGRWAAGGASRWWLHQSLLSLEGDLRKRGSGLIIRRGPTRETLLSLAAETKADAVFWNRRSIPRESSAIGRSKPCRGSADSPRIATRATCCSNLGRSAIAAASQFRYSLPSGRLAWRRLRQNRLLRQRKFLRRHAGPDRWPSPSWSWSRRSIGLEVCGETWHPGEAGAQAQMKAFVAHGVKQYPAERDRPDHQGTSRLSPHLHFGEISPRQIWHAAQDPAAAPYLRQIVWREFAHHLLFHFPQTANEPLRAEFSRFPWRRNERHFRAWSRGQTGYPLVDAGMRELWHTGWMHNRVRMVAASLLVKHLLIPWQEGAAWFWDTLVDADLSNNTLGWQWVAGCGADAAPYFRIFNPVIQGEKFDPDGSYVRRWVPELARLPDRWIHQPWSAPGEALRDAGIVLGKTYPKPLIDHKTGRERALAALAAMRTATSRSGP